MTVPPGTKTIRRPVELAFEDGSQEAANHILSHPVSNGRDAEWPFLRWGFGDIGTSEGMRLKGPTLEVPHQCREIFISVSVKHLNANFVYPRGPTVTLDGLEGVEHHAERNPSR